MRHKRCFIVVFSYLKMYRKVTLVYVTEYGYDVGVILQCGGACYEH